VNLDILLMYSKTKFHFVLRLLFILIVFNSAFLSEADAQKRKSTKSQKKELMKKQEDRKKDFEIAEEKGRKKHNDLQEKPVRKRMKKSRKAARRYDTGKRKPFFKRIFTRKRRRK
jgi:Ni/Co efflux regulator RcnB